MTEQITSAQLLAQQLKQLNELTLLLDKESGVLQNHQPDVLTAISLEKNELLLQIQQLDQQLANTPDFLADKENGLCDKPLAEIEEQLTICKEKNYLNGQVIQHSQLAVERMKTTLLEKNSKSSVTYDNKGKKNGGLSSIGIKA